MRLVLGSRMRDPTGGACPARNNVSTDYTTQATLLPKPFSPSHANQILASLAERGMIYKNRLGRYTFAVPLLGRFILRTHELPVETR